MLGPMASRLAAHQEPLTGQAAVPRYGGLADAAWTALSLLAVAVAAAPVLRGSASGEDALQLVAALVWIGSGGLVLVRAAPSRTSVLTGLTLLAVGVAPGVQTATVDTTYAWVGRLAVAVAMSLTVLTFSIFPDGQFVPRWLRWFAPGFAATQLATVVLGPLHGTADVLGGVVFFLGIGVPIGAQVSRLRREADPAERARTRWVVYGVVLATSLELLVSLPYFAPAWFPDMVAPGSPYDTFQTVVAELALLTIPICLVLAMITGHLFDVDVVISRTLVYGSLTVCVTASYLVIVYGFGLIVGSRGDRFSPLLAAAVIAVLFGPLRAWLQQRARRLVFGLRAEPYAALTGLSRELAGTMPSDDVAARIVDTVRRSLRMPYVAVAIGDESGFPIAAQSGTRTDQVLTLPLLHQGEQAGLLIVGYDEHHPLRAPDRALLHDLAEHLGSSVRGVQLTAGLRQGAADLQVARERLVLTREEERRRLRRDLHDGLAPTLAAAGLTAATASDLRELDPEESRRLLDQLQRTLRAAVGDIRTLVDGLRPPALDELGLLPALRDRIGELQGVRTTFEAPEQLPALPAAVEVAAYRICQEALMNVARHAHGRSVIVRLSVDESLHLLVEDDGVGVRSSDAPGVGLASMRERALELGGACTIDEARPSGTRVLVQLPLRLPAAGR